MNEKTHDKMKQMKFFGMYHALQTALQNEKTDGYSPDELVAFLIDSEHDDRHSRKINRHITNARFRYKAELEHVKYEADRNLDRNKVLRLAECTFIKGGENILITGSTGVGKSYLASALGHQACSLGYKLMYFNTAKLFAKMKMAKVDGSYVKEMARIERQDVIILDDFGLQPMDSQARLVLLDLVEDRHAKRSMILTSQIPIEGWYDVIGEKTVADAIMDRVVHNAHRLELKGESMRKQRTKKQSIDTNEIIN